LREPEDETNLDFVTVTAQTDGSTKTPNARSDDSNFQRCLVLVDQRAEAVLGAFMVTICERHMAVYDRFHSIHRVGKEEEKSLLQDKFKQVKD
jgi:hypothetical protein